VCIIDQDIIAKVNYFALVAFFDVFLSTISGCTFGECSSRSSFRLWGLGTDVAWTEPFDPDDHPSIEI